MAHTVLIKRSATSTAVPTGGQLAAGELAINTVDEKIFFKNSSGTVKSLSAMSDLTSNLVTISTTQTISGLKTFSEHMTLGGKKEFRFADSDSSNYVALTAATTVANNNVYTLPTAVGSANQVLAIDVVTSNDATLKWSTVSPGGSDTQVQFNDSSAFGGDAGLTYNKTTDTLTVAGDLAVNGGDITTSSSTFNIASTASTVNFATGSASAQAFTLGSNVSNSTFSLFGGSAMVATYVQSKVVSTLYFAISQTDSGFTSAVADGSMGFGCIGVTRIGDWDGAGNSNIIEIDDANNTITFYAAGANSYTFPTTRGSNGQVLTTNGSGTLSWASAGGGSKTYAVFTPLDNQPPASNFATLDTRNSIAVLDFDAATDESAVFVGIMPEGASLGSGLKIRISWMATSATSGACRWGVQIERMNTDEDSDSFDTAATGGSTTNGTSGIVTTTEITITTIDSVAAGEPFRLKVYRDADGTSGTDDMTGDAELVSVEVRSAS